VVVVAYFSGRRTHDLCGLPLLVRSSFKALYFSFVLQHAFHTVWIREIVASMFVASGIT
jgi:hypothetical protein